MGRLRRIAVVTPLYPTPESPFRGLPIFHSVKELAALADAEVEVFCPLATYPTWVSSPNGYAIAPDGGYNPGGPPVQYFGYPAFPLLSRPFNGFLSGRRLLGRLKAFAPDLILAYWIYPEGYGAMMAGERLGVPVIVGARGTDLRWITGKSTLFLTRKVLRQAQAVLAVSEELRGTALRLGVDSTRIHTILNGCDSSTFHYRDQSESRRLLGVPMDRKIILFVGRVTRSKGIYELYAALQSLLSRDPSLHLYCIGPLHSRHAEHDATVMGIGDHVHHLGPRTSLEVAQWMAAADVFCLPSHTEGCPNVVIEAMSVGAPIVATDVGGIPELVGTENAILVKPCQVEALVAALEQALGRRWDRERLSGQYGRTWSDVARETLAVCETIAASHPVEAVVTPAARSGPPVIHSRRTKPMNLIVSADDWGRTREVNGRIYELLNKRKLTSASLIANAPEIEEALAFARQTPHRWFGVHLNCTEFRPLTNSEALKPLLNEHGEMSVVVRSVALTPALIEAIKREWCAQIERVLAAGIGVDHLDSHHHSHNLPQLLPVLRELRKRYGIRSARISMNLFEKHEHKTQLLRVSKVAYNAALRYFCGFRTTDGCTNFSTFLMLEEARLARMSSIELMTHPGHPSFDAETRLLSGEWEISIPYRLIGYDTL